MLWNAGRLVAHALTKPHDHSASQSAEPSASIEDLSDSTSHPTSDPIVTADQNPSPSASARTKSTVSLLAKIVADATTSVELKGNIFSLLGAAGRYVETESSRNVFASVLETAARSDGGEEAGKGQVEETRRKALAVLVGEPSEEEGESLVKAQERS